MHLKIFDQIYLIKSVIFVVANKFKKNIVTFKELNIMRMLKKDSLNGQQNLLIANLIIKLINLSINNYLI